MGSENQAFLRDWELQLGDWPLPIRGGRSRVARDPNQAVFCSPDQKTLESGRTRPLWGVL
jgi:hypothetical protein